MLWILTVCSYLNASCRIVAQFISKMKSTENKNHFKLSECNISHYYFISFRYLLHFWYVYSHSSQWISLVSIYSYFFSLIYTQFKRNKCRRSRRIPESMNDAHNDAMCLLTAQIFAMMLFWAISYKFT